MRPISHVRRVYQEAEKCKQEVCSLLGWTETEYYDFQIDEGMNYLRLYLNNDQWGIELVMKCRQFWTWWRNHWHMRDCEFLAYKDFPAVHYNRRDLYREHNSADVLRKSITPNGIVLQDTYAYMMSVLIDQTLKA